MGELFLTKIRRATDSDSYLLGATMGKKAKKDNKSEGPAEDWAQQKKQIEPMLLKLNALREELDDKMRQAVLAHEKAAGPVYKARNDVLEAVPGFWLGAISAHPLLGAILSEQDLQILEAVKRLDVENEDTGDTERTKVTLTLSENEFMSNTTLSKTVVTHKSADGDEDESTFEVTSDTIQWKAGYGPNSGEGGKKGKKREAEEEGSLFDLFDAEQYDDDTMMEPLREVFIEADDLYAGSLESDEELDEEEAAGTSS